MINDVKLGFRLIKYSYKFKMSLICSLIFLGIGVLMLLSESQMGIGTVYFAFPAIFVCQLIYMMEAASMVRASSRQKALQTTVPAAMNLVMNVFFYTVLWGMDFVLFTVKKDMSWEPLNYLLVFGLLSVLLGCYYAMAYKIFWIATTAFVVIFMSIVFACTFLFAANRMFNESGPLLLPAPALVAVGYGMVCISAALQYGLSCLVYKKDFSKFAFAAMLRKAAQ